MLTEKIEVHVDAKPDGRLEVAEDTLIYRDGVYHSRTRRRKVIDVGDDVSGEHERVKTIATVVHTPAMMVERKRREKDIEARHLSQKAQKTDRLEARRLKIKKERD